MMRVRLPLLSTLLVISAGAAEAVPLIWNLSSVHLGDGTTVAGSFVFDADTTSFSALNVTTSGGSIVPSTSMWFFDTANPSALTAGGFGAVDGNPAGNLTGAHFVSLFTFTPSGMTNAGGTVPLDFFRGGTCAISTCGTIDGSKPFTASGSGQFVSAGPAVPEPATSLLIAAGLIGGMGWLAFVRVRRNQPA
jgi:hypothetical protein